MSTHCPANEPELIAILQAAVREGTPLQVVGGGSKDLIGNPSRRTLKISMTRFDQVIDYDPAELVVTVGAGMKLAAVEALLASREQMLAFEPFDFAQISHQALQASTIGGVIAVGFAGSRRVSAGNVRDHVLGFKAVSGRGESFVAGGRVVKNVTGYDLAKLMCGSWGQLAILTEVTLKVLPRPRMTLTLTVRGLRDAEAISAMTQALRSRASIAAAAYIPDGGIDANSRVLLRLEGFERSVRARASGLARDLSIDFEALDVSEAQRLWTYVRSGGVPAAPEAHALWRICLPSTAAVRLLERVRALRGTFCADWGGALVLAQLPETVPAARIRALAEAASGHATLLRASLAYREHASALHPESAAVAALARRVKLAFDPAQILDPMRFVDPHA